MTGENWAYGVSQEGRGQDGVADNLSSFGINLLGRTDRVRASVTWFSAGRRPDGGLLRKWRDMQISNT
jgi:hypothetical protein